MVLHLLHLIFGSNSLRYTEVYIACKERFASFSTVPLSFPSWRMAILYGCYVSSRKHKVVLRQTKLLSTQFLLEVSTETELLHRG